MNRKKIRLGDLLVQNNLLTEEQLQIALKKQKETRRKLGFTLVEFGFIEQYKLMEFLSRQLQIPFLELSQYPFKKEVVAQLSEVYARRFRAIMLEQDNYGVLIAIADPTDILALDELEKHLKKPVRCALAIETEILSSIDNFYRHTSTMNTLADELHKELSESNDELNLLDDDDYLNASSAPVTKLIQSIFEDAIQIRASDIHIEPDESVLRIRQRVDGMLQEHVMDEVKVAGPLVVKLKLMANLDISEKRVPQDGRFNVTVKDRTIDIRMSTLPNQFGESVVMRILDFSNGAMKLDKIGMPEDILEQFRSQIKQPYGLVLVTGPTGSGKTTTLYSALNELNVPEKKIITAEDPVEYSLPRVNQVQVNIKAGLNFPVILRSILRQDPDIILVGEMRDEETSKIGLRAAITGHLVFSTLHTNNAVETATRLIDMNIAGYLVASALNAVIAQRLVRRLCSRCKASAPLNTKEKFWLEQIQGQSSSWNDLPFLKAVGCQQCSNTGYRGRMGVYEILCIDDGMAEALKQNDSVTFAKRARESGFRSLVHCALDYAAKGETSLDEVIRIGGDGNGL